MRLTAQQESRIGLTMSCHLKPMFDEKLQDRAVEKEHRLSGHLPEAFRREADEEISEGPVERGTRAHLD